MSERTSDGDGAGRYASVNGLDMYYEVHGAGEPLMLLHGGFGVIGIFAAFEQLLPALATTRQVIAVEMQGHGHTADIERPLAFEQMADDVAALITHLGLEQVDLCGYSLGGGVALQTAIRHPEVVHKLVVASAPCKRNGWYPEDLAGMAMITAEAMARTPMYAAYLSVAPDPEGWTRLANNMRQLLGRDYDWSAQAAAITAPTLIVIGDADGVRPEHAVEMLRLRGGGKAHGVMDELPQPSSRCCPARRMPAFSRAPICCCRSSRPSSTRRCRKLPGDITHHSVCPGVARMLYGRRFCHEEHEGHGEYRAAQAFWSFQRNRA